MSTVKRLSGSYQVQTINPGSSVTYTTDTFYIYGNLAVLGNATYTSTQDAAVSSNFIILNEGLPQNVVPTFDAGIAVNRGTSANVAIRWHEANGRWQLSNDGVSYQNIIATNSTASFITHIVEDLTPQLGANLDTQTFSIKSTTGSPLRIENGNVVVTNTTVAPPTINNAVAFNAQTPSGGGSGLYVTNSAASNQELITKTKAVVYALIF